MGLMNTYAPLALAFDKGEGAYLWADNEKYLDLISSIAVCGLGHANAEIAEAITKQANTLLHTTNLYQINNQNQLADKLVDISGLSKVFFANSGAEANEAAIKLARKYGHNLGISEPTIIVMENSFHGRTMATLSATGNRKVQSGFEPLVSGFVRVAFDDTVAIRELAKTNNNIVAILVEPIQGEGGIKIPQPNYLSQLRAICDENNWLLMLDEIQTGIGRTGTMFNFQQHNITPDVLTLAKGLANGVPIGACLSKDDIFSPGNHGSTFGGNPLATKAGLTTLNIIERDNLCARAKYLGDLMSQILQTELGELAGVIEIRHSGLMIGIELNRPCNEIIKLAVAKNLLINVTADTVIRLLPPLILSAAEAKDSSLQVAQIIKDFLNASAD